MAGLGAPARILVIDDSQDFQILMQNYLHGTRWSFLCAGDALQATGMAVRDKPKLILLDIGLPGGDGFMLLDRLHANARTRSIPIIVTTAQTAAGLEARAKVKGAQGFLQKPFDKQKLLETLESVLRESADAATKPH